MAATSNIARGNQGKQLGLVFRALAYVAIDVDVEVNGMMDLWGIGFMGLSDNVECKWFKGARCSVDFDI